nr:hypothetical protein [Azospirillum argentinense]
MQNAHIKRAEGHTWTITINGVKDTGFRLIWTDPNRSDFRRTEGGDVESVVVAGLPDGFQKLDAFEADAELLSISHPEMWTKLEPAVIPEPAPDEVITREAPAEQPEPTTEVSDDTAPPAPGGPAARADRPTRTEHRNPGPTAGNLPAPGRRGDGARPSRASRGGVSAPPYPIIQPTLES